MIVLILIIKLPKTNLSSDSESLELGLFCESNSTVVFFMSDLLETIKKCLLRFLCPFATWLCLNILWR